jgi:hypothetical protein
LLATNAIAQEQSISTDELVKISIDEWHDPINVYRKYTALSFYVQLLARDVKLVREDINSAMVTAELVLRSIRENNAKFFANDLAGR